MVITVVTFELTGRWTEEQATKAFLSTAPNYVRTPGLIRKYYCLHADGKKTVGIYVWCTRADAERSHNTEWAARVKATYGSEPSVQFLLAPVSIEGGQINLHPREDMPGTRVSDARA